MSEQNPTVIIAHLDDEKLRKSIDSLVGYVDEKFKEMTTSTTNAVNTMQQELQKLGSLNAKGVGGAGGGELGITKALQRAKQEAKESSMNFDQMAASMQKATTGNGNKTIFSTMDTEISILKERLVEAKSQVESFTVMARRGAETGDKGLFTFSTENLHKYEAEVEKLTQQINSLTSQRQALKEMLNPQGDAFKNYVDSLTKINPELAALNNQYKRGVSLLQTQRGAIDSITSSHEKSTQTEQQRVDELQKAYELELKEREEQAKAYDIQREKTRQLEIENAKTAENLAFREKINAVRQSKQGNEGKRVRETNELTGAIAGLLGIQEREVAVTNVESASQHLLANYLNQLKTAYQRLDKEVMSASRGKMLADEIQRVSRAYAEMTKQMNRPTSLKNALGLDETTLDNIAYKIQQLNAYKMGLKLTDPNQVAEMRKVDDAVSRLKKDYDNLMGKNSQLMSSNNALARSWNYMKNRLAFYFTVGASTQFVKNLIEVRSQYEMNERALGILIDSAERGTQIFNELSKMALVSPYTLIELSNAAKQLTAYDVAARDVVDTTRRMADISAAVGIPMERLTYALGQIKAYGYLNSRDARMFLNAGIPLVKNLADHYTELEGRMVSVADVYDRMKKKAIGYNDVMQVITEMTDEGGKFFDFQAKMADTLKVQLANLTLAWNNMLNEIGKSEQGVLVGGIKGLKELFLQWGNIKNAIRNVVVTLGLVKAAQLVYYFAVRNSNNAIALHNVLGNKMSRNLKEIAVGFRNAKNAITGASTAMKSFVLTTIAIAAIATEVVELAMAWKDAEEGVKDFNKSIRDGATENYKNITNTLEQYKDLRESLYKEEERGGNNVRVAQDIDESNAKKAWEAMREEIELSSAASETYISRLMQIDNVSERLRQGFVFLDDLQAVNSALSEMGDKTIFIQQDWSSWWNLWLAPDSFEENLRDFIKAKKQIEDAYGDIEKAREKLEKASSVGDKNLKSGVSRYDQTLEQFRENLKETTDSLIDFISMKGWTGDTNKINELFAQFTNKTVMQLGLDPSEAFTFQLEIEQARAKAAKQSLQIRLEDEKQALKAARDEETKEAIQANIDRLQTELNDFDENNGRGRVLWENYTKWMKEQHMSEMTQMFRDMDEEDIKSINFQEGKWKEFAERTAMQYAKEHKISYNDAFNLLQNWVKNANKWSIFIPLTISTESGKSVYDTLTEADKAADEAWSKIQRLKTHKGELEAKGASMVGKSDIDTEYANTLKEITEAQEDYNAALAKGGHSKKENTSDTKAQKQAESELMKALKEELSLIDNIRNNYKKLTKEGETHTEAIERAVSGYDKTVNGINKVLQKYGVNNFNPSDYAGVEDPNKLVELLKAQITALISSGLAKTSEIKDIEVKIQSLNVEARSYNLKKVTDGLNNELSKLKYEYELAVELDANPELGNIFTDMFGIDTTDFPKTIDEYMQRVQDEFDKGREKFNYQTPLNVFKATESDWIRWGASVGIVTAKLDEQGNIMADDTTALDKFKAKFVEAQGVAKKWATDIVNNTKKLEYDLAELNDKIAIKEKEQVRLHEQIENEKNEVTRHYLELTYQNNQKAIDELKSQALSLMPEYARVFNSIAEHSAGVARRLQRDLMKVYDSAVFDSASNSWTLTSSNGTQTKLSDTQYRKEREKLTKEMRKSQSNFKKINEAFKPSDKDGVVDYAKGIELISEEAKKAADGMHTVADIVAALGGSEDAVETLNDIATSMEGVGTAGQGIAQIASGDYIGGAVNVLKGTWQAVSTWFDNSDKRISNEIANSERQVRRLELAYIDLEHAINDAYGTETIGAQKAAIANKELQLSELKRQLTLEQSRKKKNQDQERIIELQKQIKELEYDIKSMTDEIVNDLLGISSVGDAMESLMDSFIEALRSGEDAMAVFDDSIDNMIANMVKKMFTTKILQPWFEKQWDLIQKDIDERVGKELPKKIAQLTGQVDTAKRANLSNRDSVWEALASMGLSAEQIHQYESYDAAGNYIFDASKRFERRKELYEKMLDDKEKELDAAQREYTELTTPTVDDIKKWAVLLRSGDITVEQWQGYLDGLLTDLDLMKDSKDKTLSNLQMGLQSMSEQTANSLEAYMNGVSQQVYYHSSLLEQIRDSVAGFDIDVQTTSLSQILLQLQTNYIVMQSMQSMMEGWTIPSGQGIRVELIS